MKKLVPFCISAAFIAGCSLIQSPSSDADSKATATAKSAANAASKPAAKAKAPTIYDIMKAEVGNYSWPTIPYVELIAKLDKLRERPDIAANASFCAVIDQHIVKACKRSPWQKLKLWDPNLRHEIPKYAYRNLYNVKGVTQAQKVEFVWALVEYYAGEEKWFEAEQVVRDAVASVVDADPKRRARTQWSFKVYLINLAKWRFNYAEAWKLLDEYSKVDPRAAAKIATTLSQEETGGPDKAVKFWRNANDLYGEIMSYYGANPNCKKPADLADRAYAFVTNAANNAGRRIEICCMLYNYDNSERSRNARKSLKGINMAKMPRSNVLNNSISRAYTYGDWKLVESLFADYEGVNSLATPNMIRVRMISRAAAGDKAGAIALAEAGIANKDKAYTDLDREKFRVSIAMLKGEDVIKAIESAKLDRKNMIALVTTAGRQAVTWSMTDYAEAIAAKYASFYVQFPQRELKVAYSDKPITSINDWREIYDSLEKQYCDRKWGARVDILETDVATGRQLLGTTQNDSKNVRMEITSVCDEKGLNIFLRVEDPNARKVEAGFANGIGTEMYFAPGKYEAYDCFGSSPRGGVASAFQTAYNSLEADRVDYTGKRRGEFVSETSFSDNDYVLRLFFGWDRLAKKLPSKDRPWRFECIAFTPVGNYSWGGSAGVHNSSCWGNLTFDFTPEQLTAIRKGIILRAVKTWRKAPNERLDTFDKWADPEIGDPEFYESVLKSLEKELSSYAAKVKPTMTDAEVNEIFENALPKWVALKHEIDALRKVYLKKKFSK